MDGWLVGWMGDGWVGGWMDRLMDWIGLDWNRDWKILFTHGNFIKIYLFYSYDYIYIIYIYIRMMNI